MYCIVSFIILVCVCSRRASTASKAGGSHGNTTAPTKRPAADVLTIQERAGIGSVWTESNRDYKGLFSLPMFLLIEILLYDAHTQLMSHHRLPPI